MLSEFIEGWLYLGYIVNILILILNFYWTWALVNTYGLLEMRKYTKPISNQMLNQLFLEILIPWYGALISYIYYTTFNSIKGDFGDKYYWANEVINKYRIFK